MSPVTTSERLASNRIDLQLAILEKLGFDIPADGAVMDLGCGNGDTVQMYERRGFRAFGCDFEFKDGPHVARLKKEDKIRIIETSEYRLPFPDQTFDLIFSEQVLEHVQDYHETLAELRRVLRPGGASVHFFPSRYKFIEPHVHIPLGTMLQQYWWARIWTTLGIRNKYQKGLSASEAARRSSDYLRERTNYLSKSQIRHLVAQHFDKIFFAEREFLHSRRSGPLGKALVGAIPFLPTLYSTFRTRVLVFGYGGSYARTPA